MLPPWSGRLLCNPTCLLRELVASAFEALTLVVLVGLSIQYRWVLAHLLYVLEHFHGHRALFFVWCVLAFNYNILM